MKKIRENQFNPYKSAFLFFFNRNTDKTDKKRIFILKYKVELPKEEDFIKILNS